MLSRVHGRARLFESEAANVVAGRLARARGLVEHDRVRFEVNARIAQDFRAARRSRCEDQFHFRPFVFRVGISLRAAPYAAAASSFDQANSRDNCTGSAFGRHSRNFRGELGAGIFRRDVLRCGRLLRKRAARQFVAARFPGSRFLLRAKAHRHQQALQIENRPLEADVARRGLHFAGVAKLKSRHGAVLFERLPDHAGIVANAPVRIEALVIAGQGCAFAQGEEVGELFAGYEAAPAAKILPIEHAPAMRQLVFPAPDHFREPVPNELLLDIADIAPRDGVIERRQRNIIDREEGAVSGGVDVFHSFCDGSDAARPSDFVLGCARHLKNEKLNTEDAEKARRSPEERSLSRDAPSG